MNQGLNKIAIGTGKTGSVAGTVGMANLGWKDGAAKPAGRRLQDLPGAGSCLSQRAHHWEARMKLAVPMPPHFPGPVLSFMGWEHTSSSSFAPWPWWPAPVPEEGWQSDAPSPCTAREGVAHVRDNKLHESLDLGTAWEEKARGLISLGIQSL